MRSLNDSQGDPFHVEAVMESIWTVTIGIIGPKSVNKDIKWTLNFIKGRTTSRAGAVDLHKTNFMTNNNIYYKVEY